MESFQFSGFRGSRKRWSDLWPGFGGYAVTSGASCKNSSKPLEVSWAGDGNLAGSLRFLDATVVLAGHRRIFRVRVDSLAKRVRSVFKFADGRRNRTAADPQSLLAIDAATGVERAVVDGFLRDGGDRVVAGVSSAAGVAWRGRADGHGVGAPRLGGRAYVVVLRISFLDCGAFDLALALVVAGGGQAAGLAAIGGSGGRIVIADLVGVTTGGVARRTRKRPRGTFGALMERWCGGCGSEPRS